MNELCEDKRAFVKAALKLGFGIREVAEFAQVSRQTVRRYRDLYGESKTCRLCGRPKGHNGWCKRRFRYRPLRQAFMRRWHELDARKEDLQ